MNVLVRFQSSTARNVGKVFAILSSSIIVLKLFMTLRKVHNEDVKNRGSTMMTSHSSRIMSRSTDWQIRQKTTMSIRHQRTIESWTVVK